MSLAPCSRRGRRRSIAAAVRGAVIAALLAGCARKTPVAGVSGEEPREPRRVTVIVENNLRRPASIRVWIQPRHGDEKMLGTVLAEATESFTFVPIVPSGEYVLYARISYGGQVVSNPFPMSRTSIVRWDLYANIATTSVLEESDEP